MSASQIPGNHDRFSNDFKRLRRALQLACGALAAAWLLAPASAEAKNEFEDAFKYELGRIAAHEAAGAGRSLLGSILFGHHGHGHHGGQRRGGHGYGGYDDRYDYRYERYEYGDRYYDDDHEYRDERRHHRKHRRHHRRHHGRGHHGCDH